jgi:hypothetical protein
MMTVADERLADLLERARKSLAVEASNTAHALLKDRLQSVAAELALEWIVGDRRFESQSQQTEYWLARLYEEIFTDEQPEATRIYTRFGLPLPRSQYLARLLLARRSTRWRTAARNELVAALEAIEAKAVAAEKAKSAQTQRFDLSLSRGGYDELIVLYDFMAGSIAGQSRPSPPKRIPSSPTLVWFSLTAEAALGLLKYLRGGKA